MEQMSEPKERRGHRAVARRRAPGRPARNDRSPDGAGAVDEEHAQSRLSDAFEKDDQVAAVAQVADSSSSGASEIILDVA